MRSSILKILFYLTFSYFFCQETNNYTPDLVPKTPEAAALDKFIDIPAGRFNGRMTYSIPMYNIPFGKYSIPISIDYSGTGIKVNEIASTAGLGWVLNTGNINLSKKIVGYDDDRYSKISLQWHNFHPEIVMSPDYAAACFMVGYDAGIGQSNPALVMFERRPDYYNYSLLNNHGKFIIDIEDNYQTIPKDNVKIINLNHFIDNDGIHYYFSQSVENENYVASIGGDWELKRPISYRIDSISDHMGHKVKFFYGSRLMRYVSDIYENRKLQIDCNGHGTEVNHGFSDIRYSSNIINAREKVIDRIEFEGGLIEFNYNEDELLEGSRNLLALREIKIYSFLDYNHGNPLNSSPLRSYSLYHTEKDANMNTQPPLLDNEIFQNALTTSRLVLDSLIENNTNSQFTFFYFNNNELPHRLSNAVDYWGFYNGHDDNEIRVPRTLYQSPWYFEYPDSQRILAGALREPSLDFTKTLTLEKVKLPTGGFQEFDYELNDYKFDNIENQYFLNSANIESNNGVTNINVKYPIRYEYMEVSNNPVNGELLNFKDGFDYRLEFYYEGNPLESCDNCLPEENQEYYYGILYRGEENPLTGNISWSEVQRLYDNGESILEELDPGKEYCFEIKSSSTNMTNPSFCKLSLKWYQNNEVYVDNKEVGGLRIKSIKLKDENGNLEYFRKYNYKEAIGSPFSSGKFYGRDLDFNFLSKEIGSPVVVGPSGNCQYRVFSSHPSLGLEDIYGQSSVYDNVQESYLDKTDSLLSFSKEYHFFINENHVDVYGNINHFPIIQTIPDNSYNSGILLEEKIYDSDGNLKTDIVNTYDFNNYFNNMSPERLQTVGENNKIATGYEIQLVDRIGRKLINNEYYTGFLDAAIFEWNYYYVMNTWIKKIKTETTEYFNSGNIINTTDYYYDSEPSEFNSQILPIETQTTTSSTGEMLEQKFYYPQDLLSEPFMSSLVTQNRIATPIKTETYRGTMGNMEKLSETHTLYQDFDPTSEKQILPSSVHTGKLSEDNSLDAIESKITYDDYDDKGNILQYTLENGTPVSIIWGYNGQYPLAKIEGATYSQIQSAVINLQTLSANDDDSCTGLSGCEEANLRNALNQFRVNNPSYLISTYTYDPLIGVTSIMASDGTVQYYQYDGLGRLKQVKDQDGNVLKEMEYHYQEVTN